MEGEGSGGLGCAPGGGRSAAAARGSGRRRHGTTTTVTGTRRANGYPLGAAQGHGVAGKARRGGDGIPDSRHSVAWDGGDKR